MDYILQSPLASAIFTVACSIIARLCFDYRATIAKRDSIKSALAAELTALLQTYLPLSISVNPPQADSDVKVISLSANYTTVYANNAEKLGLLDKQVSKSVVIAYTNIAALMDTLKIYAQRWECMVAAERDSRPLAIYWQDVNECHRLAYEQQIKTLQAINEAIEKLR